MQNHMEQYNLDHAERVAQAERERMARAAVAAAQANRPPNRVMMKLGAALVEAGEQIQAQARQQPQRHRRRA
ncbi:MAG: hypothetical protein AAF653_04310 [Chloroflexota bacterium]